jgi:ribosomal RNA small subunit methyltransferase RsmB
MQMPSVSPARKAAFQILLAVEQGVSHSDDLLHEKQVSKLSAADRNLATALVLGVLRWQIRLDAEIKKLVKKPGARMDPEVLTALRMGAFQLLHLDRIPARAAIDESVELTKHAGHRFASGMVNAVLRKLSTAQLIAGEEKNASELALAQAHPQWLVDRWVQAYGLQEAAAICRHGQQQPDLTVRIVGADAEMELVDAGVVLGPAQLVASARNVIGGDVIATAAFREGKVRFQDEGSQLIAEIAVSAANESGRRPEKILDACAAPGGKTLILVERNPESHIVACDASEQRHAQLCKRLRKFSNYVECRHADASKLVQDENFDLALVDVPCSGTGTLGRNPEIRHRLHMDDLPRQAERQRAILNAVLRSVRSGGRVVYSTCSLEPEENDWVVAAALAVNPAVRLMSLEPIIGKMAASEVLTKSGAEQLSKYITKDGALRLLPSALGTDGFFVALFERAG